MIRSIAVACVALLACGCAHRAAATEGRAVVTHVIDGDTVVVRIGGRGNVRLLGIDTSRLEVEHPPTDVVPSPSVLDDQFTDRSGNPRGQPHA